MKEEGEKSEEPEGAEDQQEGPLWKSGLVSREAEHEIDSIQDLVGLRIKDKGVIGYFHQQVR